MAVVAPFLRQENLYLAKLAEQTERYDEMLEFMDKVVSTIPDSEELTTEERNLLSFAYKKAIDSRRASWHIMSSKEQEEDSRGKDDRVATVRNYRLKIESEISSICDRILKLLDSRLIPSSRNSDAVSRVFYLKMKGDYHRYLAEFKSDDDNHNYSSNSKEAAESTSLNAYKAGREIANAELAPTHPMRLGVALNLSVFYHNILNSPDRARNLAKLAFDEANAAELDTTKDDDDSYKDTTLIMQLLRDNLSLWT